MSSSTDELRLMQSFFVDEKLGVALPVGGYTGGPDCPCADDPYGCDGACLGA